jgi:hypothetical protein
MNASVTNPPWKALLLAYRRIDVRFTPGRFRKRHFAHELSSVELEDALDSFRAFPALAHVLSEGEASVTHEIVVLEEPLSSVTRLAEQSYWPSPEDTRADLDRYAPRGRFDSIFILWPQRNLSTGAAVPCPAWGYGCGPSESTHGATYAPIANAPTWAWKIPLLGEVWLHEWLHGVCAIFADRGVVMPEYDADGGGSHGYTQSPTDGWSSYYRDLMTGQVPENGMRMGITQETWRGYIPVGA